MGTGRPYSEGESSKHGVGAGTDMWDSPEGPGQGASWRTDSSV